MPETVGYILFECEKYETERRKLVRKLKSVRSQLGVDILRKEFKLLLWYLRESKVYRVL